MVSLLASAAINMLWMGHLANTKRVVYISVTVREHYLLHSEYYLYPLFSPSRFGPFETILGAAMAEFTIVHWYQHPQMA
jgi:hypothetical protein